MDITKMSNNEITNYLREERDCALILWRTDDAIRAAMDEWGIEITEEQAAEIMCSIDENKDCEFGITWDTVYAEVHDYLRDNDLID